jgi:hypothetical protein
MQDGNDYVELHLGLGSGIAETASDQVLYCAGGTDDLVVHTDGMTVDLRLDRINTCENMYITGGGTVNLVGSHTNFTTSGVNNLYIDGGTTVTHTTPVTYKNLFINSNVVPSLLPSASSLPSIAKNFRSNYTGLTAVDFAGTGKLNLVINSAGAPTTTNTWTGTGGHDISGAEITVTNSGIPSHLSVGESFTLINSSTSQAGQWGSSLLPTLPATSLGWRWIYDPATYDVRLSILEK